MMISGFTFCHNSLDGGYPVAEAIAAVRPFVDEVVAVDIASTDGTRALLERCADVVYDAPWDIDKGTGSSWDTDGRDPMLNAFRLHVRCKGDKILLFEADEIFAPSLAQHVCAMARVGAEDLRVWRLQVSQNAQRLQWAPHPVHRLFPKGAGSYLDNPVIAPENIPVVDAKWGYLWDVTMWFRDNYWKRREAHGQCWGAQRNVIAREHFLQPTQCSDEELKDILDSPHWTTKSSPFALPELVRGLLGMTEYKPTV